ncbi:MAG: hypothetical protein Q7J67_06255 [bacterium]|nr:hypothetical protein [bacterium]
MLVVALVPSAHADKSSDVQKRAAYFASLPIPKGNPALWQWPSTISQRVKQMLGAKGTVYPHYPKAVAPKTLMYPFDISKCKLPETGRGHGGMTYVNWKLGLEKLIDLSIDITFHTKPQPPAAVYIQLYDFHIGKTGQYFGFQYSFNKNVRLETKFVWSRWGTRDKANAWVQKGGWIESAGYEGDFVGIRYPYKWGKGTYTVHLMMRNTDEAGTWYEMRICDHQKKKWTKIGRLRFPQAHDGGLPFIKDGGGSWCEVYGGTKSSADIGVLHLSYGGVYTCGRTIAAREVSLNYGKTSPNSNISIDYDGRRVHVKYGEKTRRLTPAGKHELKKELR